MAEPCGGSLPGLQGERRAASVASANDREGQGSEAGQRLHQLEDAGFSERAEASPRWRRGGGLHDLRLALYADRMGGRS